MCSSENDGKKKRTSTKSPSPPKKSDEPIVNGSEKSPTSNGTKSPPEKTTKKETTKKSSAKKSSKKVVTPKATKIKKEPEIDSSPNAEIKTEETAPVDVKMDSIKTEENDTEPSSEKKETPEPVKKTNNLTAFFTRKSDDKSKDNNSQAGIDYNPGKKNYHPINDAFWKHGERVPYLALTQTFAMVEDISGRLRTIEVLSNFLRSVIVLSPDDLLACVYLCMNQLAPTYEGLELGVAETSLMKVIAQTTGRSMSQVKADSKDTGDLGIVAERSKSNQRMMFVPAPLTVNGVFLKLKEIAKMSGHAVSNCFK